MCTFKLVLQFPYDDYFDFRVLTFNDWFLWLAKHKDFSSSTSYPGPEIQNHQWPSQSSSIWELIYLLISFIFFFFILQFSILSSLSPAPDWKEKWRERGRRCWFLVHLSIFILMRMMMGMMMRMEGVMVKWWCWWCEWWK